MRRIHRPAEAPDCLAKFAHGRDTWDDVRSDDKAALWARLDPMQGNCCAYCEGDLDDLGRHIEHHCPKGRRPAGTFEWTNLLGCCDRADSCGHFKDSRDAPTYACGDLVDPSHDDPDKFFVIRTSGRIDVRPGLGERERARAKLTIKVLNLNLDQAKGGRSLCAERRRVLETYLSQDPDLLQALEELEPEARAVYIAGEVASEANSPFGSILRHFFQAAG